MYEISVNIFIQTIDNPLIQKFFCIKGKRKGLTNSCLWNKIHTITMAEVAVLISTFRFGNCRKRKGTTAEVFAGAKRQILGPHRICAELSSERMECGRGVIRTVLPCVFL